MKNFTEKGALSPALVDKFSDLVAEQLKTTKLSGKNIMRFRLSLETAMGVWLRGIATGAPCVFNSRKRFGRVVISVSCEGPRLDPREQGDEDFGELSDLTMLQSLGLSMSYSYENGINQISFMPPSGVVMQLAPVLGALILGFGAALLIKYLFPGAAEGIYTQAVSPVFNTLMNAMKAVAGPLIFLAVLSGIYSIGDMSVLGKIGKKLIGRFLLMTYFCMLIVLVPLLCLVDVSTGAGSGTGSAVGSIVDMVLQIVPGDIVSPFLNGNTMQIIFIAAVCGMALLVLGKKAAPLCEVAELIYSVVQLIMEAISKLVPFFVFVSILGFGLSNNVSDLSGFLLPLAVIVGGFILFAVVYYGIRIKLTLGLSPAKLFKKLLPTFMIAVTTASSTAAFSTNMDTCEKELGISPTLTKFGIPLGQVMYMPMAAVEFLAISMILAQQFGVAITPLWIVTAVLISGIFAVAAPPIPGGSLSIWTMMFLQLDIPAEALAIAVGLSTLTDYIATAGNLACLQEELILCSAKTNNLDIERLKK